MGRGFRCGFLGMLHLEIIIERLRREFNMKLVVTQPTTVYEITTMNGEVEEIYSPAKFPDDGTVQTRARAVGRHYAHFAERIHGRHLAAALRPRGKDGEHADDARRQDRAQGRNAAARTDARIFRQIEKRFVGIRLARLQTHRIAEADVVRLDILVAEEPVPAFARIVSRRRVQLEAEQLVEKLENLLPKQLFELKIQAKTNGRIIASRRKSRDAQRRHRLPLRRRYHPQNEASGKTKKGKKKMLARGKVDIPHDVFLKVVRESRYEALAFGRPFAERFGSPGAKKMIMPRATKMATTPHTMFSIFLVRLWKRKLIFGLFRVLGLYPYDGSEATE